MPQNNTKKNSCTCLSSTGLKQDIYSVLCIPDAILPFFKKEDKGTLNCQAYEIFLKKHNPDILFLMPAFLSEQMCKGRAGRIAIKSLPLRTRHAFSCIYSVASPATYLGELLSIFVSPVGVFPFFTCCCQLEQEHI